MKQKNSSLFHGFTFLQYPKEEKSFKEIWRDFFSNYGLDDVKETLSEVLDACLCSDSTYFQEPSARGDVSLFLAHIFALLEAKYEKEALKGNSTDES